MGISMGFDNFLSQALDRPNDKIAYAVSRSLAALHPDRAVVEGSDYHFDLREYADAGECEIVGERDVYNQSVLEWRGRDRPTKQRFENAWLNVLWRGELLDVIYLTWTDEGCRTRFFWIVAATRETAVDLFRAVCDWCSSAHGEVLVFEGGRWRKDDELFAGIESATFDTLVLPPELAGELREDVARFFASREAYGRYGVAWRRGLLFTGPPGNGKTHTVKAIVNLCGISCLYVRGLKSYFDSVDANIHAVFDRARRAAPCVLVFEDLDSLVDKKSRSPFLNELDGFAPNAGVLTLATSNYPERIDAALVDRPGRFDRTFVFELPADAERREYVERWNAALAPDARASAAGVSAAARASAGFSFAMLKELLVTSMTEWFQGGARAMDDVLASRAAALRPRKEKRKKKKK